MARPLVVRALERQYARALGDLRHHEAKAAELRDMLEHIRAVLRSRDMAWDEAGIVPLGSCERTAWPRHGVGIRTALNVLRLADTPLTAQELVRLSFAALGASPPDKATVRALAAPLVTSLGKRVGKGIERHPGRPARWSITKPDAQLEGGWRNGSG